ncbi:hypothetical protein KKY_3935 [Pelagibacterium halotolerans B2]|uniref:Uncharacterized protein n=1 Tax=Pelagibacterium halotolerans (strain DSM 22347 / JCM 15775 / CGMCC 1.7692 / B2) TaxID=1082931 RepID=G4REI4_PELHB|nr:hypothetical protein KKY_3935 [Pelagibacterium halotolerans B2]
MRPASVSGARFAAIVLLGPIVGTLVVIAAVLVTDPPFAAFDDEALVLPLALGMGWALGLLPAILAAIGWRLALRHARIGQHRLLASLAIGGATGLIGGVPGAIAIFGTAGIFPAGLLLMALAGAFALAATALPWSKT